MIQSPRASQPAPSQRTEESTRLASPGDHLWLPADKVVSLSVTDGPQKGEVFRLSKARVVVGRSGVDIVLTDPEVSRKHCAIEVRGITAKLVDLGTTNGTFVGGQRVESCELEHLSEFRLGATTLLFTVRDEG